MSDTNVTAGFVKCRAGCRCDACTIDRLVAHNTQLRKALIPFTHPDFRLRLGGNSPTEGADAIVFQRNAALLRLKDFDLAAEVTGHE